MKNDQFISIEEFFKDKLPSLQNNTASGDQTVVFIGAGLSTNYGCSKWEDLAKDVIKKCHEHKMDYITSQDLLKRESSYKTLLTIGKQFLSKHNKDDVFVECVKKSLNDKNIPSHKTGIYLHLKKIFKYFITTNADRQIDVFFDETKIKYADISPNIPFEPDTLYKIHGCISEPDTMVFTTEQYLKHYLISQDTTKYTLGNFLQKIFSNYSVIFIGYGLAEFELLERVIGVSGKKHFIINGYFKHQSPLIEAYDLYFNLLNVQQVVYYLDKVGYTELNNWIEDYHNIKQSAISKPLADFNKIDEALGI